MARVKEIVEKIIASSLIYLPSSAKDFENPDDRHAISRKYVRGSHGIDYSERIKIMKLLWDAIGTEFGGRHELYEMQLCRQPRGHPHPGAVERARLRRATTSMIALADQCMADYDENGWSGELGSTRTMWPIRALPRARARRGGIAVRSA